MSIIRVVMWVGLFALFLGGNVYCQGTVIPGGIVNNMTWALSGSPYRIKANIEVLGLIINPGVVVLADPGVEIKVTGALVANGTVNQRIRFTEGAPGKRWAGLYYFNSWKQCSLKHCEVTGANRGGLRISNNSGTPPTIEGCLIANNTNTTNGGGVNIKISNGSITLKDCIIQANIANPTQGKGDYAGGGLYGEGNISLIHCFVRDNHCNGYRNGGHSQSTYASGGGVALLNGKVVIQNCCISSNLAYAFANAPLNYPYNHSSTYVQGAGLYLHSTDATVANTLICRNETRDYSNRPANRVHVGGVYVQGGSAQIVNATVARNRIQPNAISVGGGYLNNAKVVVKNSIFYYNVTKGNEVLWFTQAPTVSYSCIFNNPFPASLGNISVSPGFYQNGEMITDSMFNPCIDAGDPGAQYNDALIPPTHPFGPGLGSVRNDIGAHGGPGGSGWIAPTLLGLSVSPQRSPIPKEITIVVTGANPRAYGIVLFTALDSAKALLFGPEILLPPFPSQPGRRTEFKLGVPPGIWFPPFLRFEAWATDNQMGVFRSPLVDW